MLSIIARVAQALAYGYLRNVVHRDINPANIMYDPQAEIKRSPRMWRSVIEAVTSSRRPFARAQLSTIPWTLLSSGCPT